ncbi:MAG: FliM/FliN family flagellar motor switch protein [Acidobacteriia bacterium]|nr:FliM/FliN family flagellar motor switch protein [Terriglobia bacterium]
MNEQIARYGKLPLPFQPELGRCSLTVGEILALAPGSLIKLSRPLGEKIDVKVAGVRFGSGELVRVGGVLSVRLAGFHNGHDE